jgi:hypothetical protein
LQRSTERQRVAVPSQHRVQIFRPWVISNSETSAGSRIQPGYGTCQASMSGVLTQLSWRSSMPVRGQHAKQEALLSCDSDAGPDQQTPHCGQARLRNGIFDIHFTPRPISAAVGNFPPTVASTRIVTTWRFLPQHRNSPVRSTARYASICLGAGERRDDLHGVKVAYAKNAPCE